MTEDHWRNRENSDRNEQIDKAKLLGLTPSNKLCDCCGWGNSWKMKGETNMMLNQWQVLL